MSNIEYNTLLFETSQRLVELNVQEQLVFMRKDLVECSADNIQSVQDVLSLFKLLEEYNHLGPDCLVVMKDLLKGFREWSIVGKVEKFESKRKEYVDLLEQIIRVLDELSDLERLISICRGKIPEESEANINDVRSLFQVLENHSCLRIDRLGILKEILIEFDREDLLKEVDDFKKRRCDDEKEERRKAQAAAVVSCVRTASERIIGEVGVHCTFRKISGALLVVGTGLILHRCSSLEDFVQAFTVAALPAASALRAISEGSVCFTVQAENRLDLEALWQRYRDGTLQKDLQEFLVTEEVRELADGQEVMVYVYIDEKEFKNALEDMSNVNERVFVFSNGREEERPVKMHRRNSDSNLYCKIRDGEGPKEKAIEPEKPVTCRDNYLDQERLAFVQSYLETADDARSMTTETSDSGMPGTRGAPSELGMEEENESTYKLRLKDLNKDMVNQLTHRLEKDPVAQGRFYQSFGLVPEKMKNPTILLRDIRKLFPGTSVSLLRDVFEALQLQDLVELLEKAKPLALHPALPLKEIEKLWNASNRPTKLLNKAAVLIIDHRSQYDIDEADDVVESIKSVFKVLNAQSEVATITTRALKRKENDLREIMQQKMYMEMDEKYDEDNVKYLRLKLEEEIPKKRELLETNVLEGQETSMHLQSRPLVYQAGSQRSFRFKTKREPLTKESQLKRLIEMESNAKNELERVVRRREQRQKEEKPKMEEEIKLMEDELQKGRENIQMELSTTPKKRELLETNVLEGQETSMHLQSHPLVYQAGSRSFRFKTKREPLTKESQLKRLIEMESNAKNELERVVRRREQRQKEEKPKMEEEIKLMEDELQKGRENIQMELSTTLNEWTHKEDKTSTLFAVFEISYEYDYEDYICNIQEMIERCLFTLNPHCTKLLVTSREWNQIGDIPETLNVMHERRGCWDKHSLDPMLQILSKRWQTLDLISIMHEVKRTVRFDSVKIIDSLPFLPRFQKTEKDPQL